MKVTFSGNGTVWDPKHHRRLCKFEGGKFETTDKYTIDFLVERGYESDYTKEPTEKELLLEMAISRGIEADARWGVKRLKEAIGDVANEYTKTN